MTFYGPQRSHYNGATLLLFIIIMKYYVLYIIVCAIFIRLEALRRLHHSAIGIFQIHYNGRSSSIQLDRSVNNPLLVKLPKSRITAHLHSFIPLFSRLWNKLCHSIHSHSSLQAFKTAVHHHLLSSPIQILDLP